MNSRKEGFVVNLMKRIRQDHLAETAEAHLTSAKERELCLAKAFHPDDKEVCKYEATLANILSAINLSRSEQDIRRIASTLFMLEYCHGLEASENLLTDNIIRSDALASTRHLLCLGCRRIGEQKWRVINDVLNTIEDTENREARDDFFKDFNNGLREKLVGASKEKTFYVPLSSKAIPSVLRIRFNQDRQEDRFEITQQPRFDGPMFWGIEPSRLLVNIKADKVTFIESHGNLDTWTYIAKAAGPVVPKAAEAIKSLHCLFEVASKVGTPEVS
jgi:predicted secreted protein